MSSPLVETTPLPASAPSAAGQSTPRHGWNRFFIALGLWSALAAWPLIQVVSLAWQHDIYSHLILIPFISAYFLWDERLTLPAVGSPALGWAGAFFAVAVACGAAGWGTAGDVRLAWWVVAYVVGVSGWAAVCLGRDILMARAFAFGFLIFLVPLPETLIAQSEVLLQHASAEVSDWMFTALGMPFFRQGLEFRLPGLAIEVAQECSGFRSTLVLFIVSVIAAKIFLRSPWHRTALVGAILPLGILRNAFRIATLAWLTVHVDPGIIHSPLHHRGGPVFFALSLIPLNLLLWWLYRREKRQRSVPKSPSSLPSHA